MNKKHGFYIMNVMLYSMITLYNSYIPLKLSFLATDLKGALLSIPPIITLFAPLLWGILADRMKYRKRLLAIMCIISAIFFISICVNTSYLLLFPAVIFYAFFSSSYGSLSDTITISYCQKNNIKYGQIRLMGTLGYGFFAVISGILLNFSSYALPILYGTLAVLIAFVINSLPEEAHHKKTDFPKKKQVKTTEIFKTVFKIPNLLVILFFTFSIHYPLTYFYSFYSEHFINELKNPEWYWGIIVFATVLGEVPLLLNLDKLSIRFGPKKIFLVSGILTVLRYAFLMLFNNIIVIVFISLLSGYITTATFYTSTRYIADRIPENIKATGQAILYSSTALAGISANLLGGAVANRFGIVQGMSISLVLATIAVLCMLKCKLPLKPTKL